MTQQAMFETAMRRALSLAANGPVTGGNPQVGCVLIDDSGAFVAEGWHRGAGTAHAEVDALSQLAAGPGAGAARGLTAVVTLEPCNHSGRTGPCTEALVAAGISRVVFAQADPGRSSGGGSERLRAAGVDVIAGVLEDEVGEFMRPWILAARLGRPYVTIKWASSLDGRVAADDGSSKWITGAASRQHVHEQRARNDAILVGTGTVLADDPSLTARGDAGELLPVQPLPVVVGETPVPADARVRSHPAGLVETGSRDLAAILADLYARDIRRVFVEGGPTLASALIREGLADEYLIYLAPLLIGGRKTAIGEIGVGNIRDAQRLHLAAAQQLGDDLLLIARPAPTGRVTDEGA